jgi:gamma-glutamyl-gamma-aminobutyrate hydrolase PuuD
VRGSGARPTIDIIAATGGVVYGQRSGPPGDSLLVTGRYEDDTVEALEDPTRPFVLGVLWYPEEDEKSHLTKALVSEVF